MEIDIDRYVSDNLPECLRKFYSYKTKSKVLMTLKEKAFENIVGKEKMLVTKIFSFSEFSTFSDFFFPPQCFLPYQK